LAYFWSNDLFRAHADLDTAFSIDPNNAVVYRGRGLLALAASQFREAASAFTTALEKEAGSTFALHRRAEAYLALGKPSLALTDIAEIIHLEPQDLQAYAWRALIFRMQDNPDGSRAQAVAVMAARPEDPYAYALAASIYAASQAPIDSMRTLDQAVQRMPSENSFLYRAERRKYTDSAGARADIEAALQLNPQSERAASLLASLQTQSGAYEDALRTLSALLAREGHGSDSRFLVRRAVAYSKNHQVELAQKDLQDALGHAGTAVELNDLCWVLGTAGVLLTEALQACDEAIPKAVLPPSAIHDSRGFVLLKLARYPESIAAYDAALRINPFSADSLYGRGLARKAAGDSAGGEQDIRRAFKADASIAQRFASFGFPL
jgi:tetratricopeptide (TPR) repeat protein